MSQDILDLLTNKEMTKICAPMVRYSKLPFRTLVRKYDCDVCFTPMILADSFVQSSKARSSEFSTSSSDTPLIVQFAAKETTDFTSAAEMIAPYSNGVDLNCGCPQRWAMNDGYGADLLSKPELVKDLIQQVRNRIPKPFTVSVKIRLLKDMKKTIELCRRIEMAGASFLTIHARTPEMRNEPIDLENLKLAKSSVQVPVIANGNVRSLEDAESLYQESQCNGIMVAAGLLTNPALFSGFVRTPLECIQDWLNITATLSTPFMCMHHHFVFMLEKILDKKERQIFNTLKDETSVHHFLKTRFEMEPKILSEECELRNCEYNMTSFKVSKKKRLDEDMAYDLENLFL